MLINLVSIQPATAYLVISDLSYKKPTVKPLITSLTNRTQSGLVGPSRAQSDPVGLGRGYFFMFRNSQNKSGVVSVSCRFQRAAGLLAALRSGELIESNRVELWLLNSTGSNWNQLGPTGYDWTWLTLTSWVEWSWVELEGVGWSGGTLSLFPTHVYSFISKRRLFTIDLCDARAENTYQNRSQTRTDCAYMIDWSYMNIKS